MSTQNKSTAARTATCLLGDPCLFNLSPTHNEQSGRVVGRTFGRIMLFDIEMPNGLIHQNVSNVRLDCASLADH